MKTIGGLLGRSPFGPLREHMLKVKDVLQWVIPLVKSFLAGRHDEVQNVVKEISKTEHEADFIKKQIRDRLSKSLFTSISRADVLNLLKEQDSIADACEEVAILMAVRNTFIEKELGDSLLEAVQQAVETALLICEASAKLTDLEGDFQDKKVKDIYSLIEEVQKKEWDTDRLQQAFLGKLFLMEEDMKPMDTFFLMTIIRQIGWISDHADNTGDCMRRILAK